MRNAAPAMPTEECQVSPKRDCGQYDSPCEIHALSSASPRRLLARRGSHALHRARDPAIAVLSSKSEARRLCCNAVASRAENLSLEFMSLSARCGSTSLYQRRFSTRDLWKISCALRNFFASSLRAQGVSVSRFVAG